MSFNKQMSGSSVDREKFRKNWSSLGIGSFTKMRLRGEDLAVDTSGSALKRYKIKDKRHKRKKHQSKLKENSLIKHR